jgi:pyridoxal phosphate enzyme (YggS family)
MNPILPDTNHLSAALETERNRYADRLHQNLPIVRERIRLAALRAGRSDEVRIVAVTKGHGAGAVLAAADVGLGDCGENRVSELAGKHEILGHPVRWHLIGHLQRNKVRQAIGLFDWIHSLDSLRLAVELSREAERAGREVEALVQVNTSGELAKGGLTADEVVGTIVEITNLPRLHVRGLMTMAPFTEDEAVLRQTFRRTRELLDACVKAVPGLAAQELSMGMSNDYEVAVEEGSTIVRLGTVLFGERTP